MEKGFEKKAKEKEVTVSEAFKDLESKVHSGIGLLDDSWRHIPEARAVWDAKYRLMGLLDIIKIAISGENENLNELSKQIIIEAINQAQYEILSVLSSISQGEDLSNIIIKTDDIQRSMQQFVSTLGLSNEDLTGSAKRKYNF